MGFSVVIYAHTKRSGLYVFYYLWERSTPTGSDRSETIKKGRSSPPLRCLWQGYSREKSEQRRRNAP